jgi:hypothetical protein
MIPAGVAFFVAWLAALAASLSMMGHDVAGSSVAAFALFLWATATE